MLSKIKVFVMIEAHISESTADEANSLMASSNGRADILDSYFLLIHLFNLGTRDGAV